MKHTIISISLLLPAIAFAQNSNLNPTVQVTNDYQAKVKEVSKPASVIPVPDSLYKFDLDFHYDGFENPYKGTDVFSPYLTDLDLAKRNRDQKRFYLKLGAGYSPAPVLQFAYTMKDSGLFKCGLHALHNSYWGKYYINRPYEQEILPLRNESSSGYEASSSAGFDGRFDWKNYSLLMNIDYLGAHFTRNWNFVDETARNFNSVKADLIFNTNMPGPWRFGMGVHYSFCGDRIKVPESKVYYEHNTSVNFSVMRSISSGHSFVGLDADVNYSYGFLSGAADYYCAYTVVASPHYCYDNGKVYVDAGIGMMFSGGQDEGKADMIQTGGNSHLFDIFPTLKFKWNAVNEVLELFADASLGGSLLGASRKALKYGFYLDDSRLSIVKNMKADFGFRGNIVDAVQYKIYGEYDKDDNAPLFNVINNSSIYDVMIVHDTFRSVSAGAEISVKVGGFSFGGDVIYRYYLDKDKMAAVPPCLKATCDAKYEIMKRIGIGVGMSYTSEYLAGTYKVPQFFDLRALLDYKINRIWTIFVNGSNLLDNSCQEIPLISRRGFCITGGAVLNF